MLLGDIIKVSVTGRITAIKQDEDGIAYTIRPIDKSKYGCSIVTNPDTLEKVDGEEVKT